MALFLVRDADRWGYSLNVVRADTAEEAILLVKPDYRPEKPGWRGSVEVTPLPAEGPNGIVWCYDHSPDSVRD